MPRIRVALVNDYEIVLEGLRALLRPYAPGIRVVELDVRSTPESAVDVTLFDTYGETTAPLDRIRDLASDNANGAVVVFSFSEDIAVANGVVRAGARGFISKAIPAPEIVDGIRAAARGERVTLVKRSQHAAMAAELGWPGRDMRLTERESELLALLPTGMTNRELGAHLFLSENTIKTQCEASSLDSMSATVSKPWPLREPASSENVTHRAQTLMVSAPPPTLRRQTAFGCGRLFQARLGRRTKSARYIRTRCALSERCARRIITTSLGNVA
jgi:NarL family two-component system response regulator LiaR